MDYNTYFSHEALKRFVAAEGQTVEKVVCHLWQNLINNDATVELIDNLELYFSDDKKLTISCNDAGDALDAIHFDYKVTAQALEKEFEGKIKLFAVNATSTKMWEDVIGQQLESVRIVKEGEYHRAGSVLLGLQQGKTHRLDQSAGWIDYRLLRGRLDWRALYKGK